MHPQSTAVQLPLFVFDKRCSKCEQTKPLEEFHRQSANADGHHRWCKACCADHSRAYHARRDAEGRAYVAVTTKRCSRCGERKEAAAFAHNRRTRDGLFGFCRTCSAAVHGAWRAANAPLLAAYQSAYAPRHAQNQALYYAAHRAYYRQKRREWVAAHREHNRDLHRRWREAHPGYYAAQGRRRYQATPLAYYVWSSNRRARKRGAQGHFSRADVRALEAAQAGLCSYCTEPYGRYHLDHKTPLIRGGTNWPDNLALTCAHCNLRKHTKTEGEFRVWAAAGVR